MNLTTLRAALFTILCLGSGPALCAGFVGGEPLGTESKRTTEERFGGPGKSMPVERGQIEGSGYVLWDDGVAEVAHWRIYCSADAMTDQLTCAVNSGDLWISYSSGKLGAVSVGAKRHPGKMEMAVRVDGEKAVSSKAHSWFGKEAERLVASMARGNVIRTRFTKWPDETHTDGAIVAGGLKGATAAAKRLSSKSAK